MKNSLFWSLWLFPLYLSAQADFSLYLDQGYLHNLFRNPANWAPPNNADLSPSQLIQSGIFTEIKFAADWERKWATRELGLSGKIGGQVFPSLRSANELDLQLKQSFEQEVSKQFHLYQKASWRLKNRSGSDVAQELFTLPNAYQQVDFLGGIRWRPNRSHLLKLEAGKTLKQYRPGETSALQYSALAFRLYHQYRFANTEYLQRWTTSIKYQLRWYERERFPADLEDLEEEEDFDFEEEIDFTTYDMRYFIVDTELRYQLGEQWTLRPSLEGTLRQSEEDRLHYWQIEPTLKVGFQQGKWEVDGRTTFAYRKSPFLEPGTQVRPLTYQYTTFASTTNYQWNDQWAWTTSLTLTKRWSNFDEPTSRAFRPYLYWRISSGIRCTF